MRRWMIATAGMAAFVVSAGAVCWATLPRARGDGPVGSAPLAVVLVPRIGGSALVAVDLRGGRVVRRVDLRSTVTDMDVDESTGLVVCAHAGGLGPEADDAASVVNVRSGEVSYVELPCRNPGEVVCVGGLALLRHGVVMEEGLVITAVEAASHRVVASGRVTDGPGAWASAGGHVWTIAGTGPARRVVRIDPRGMSATEATIGGGLPIWVASAGDPLVVFQESTDPALGVDLSLIDPDNMTVTASVSTLLPGPPQQVAAAGDRLFVGSWTGDEPERRSLRAFDRRSLHPLGEYPVNGVPCALTSWGDRLLVVDRIAGRLLVMDPFDGRVERSIDLGVGELVFSDVIMLPQR